MEPLRPDDTEQQQEIAKALKVLRGIAGLSLQVAADKLAALKGVPKMSKQAWHPYELGKATITEERLAEMLAAIGADEADLWREIERARARRRGKPSVVPPQQGGSAERGAPGFLIPMRGRVGTGIDPVDGAHHEAFAIDIRDWLGPNVRYALNAGDQMSGYLESGSPAFYDLLLWPQPGRGCVVEKKSGELLIALYERDDGSTVFVRTLKPEPRTHALPKNALRGVYKIVLRGD